MNPASGELNAEEHIQLLQPDRVDGEEVYPSKLFEGACRNVVQDWSVRRGAGSIPASRGIRQTVAADPVSEADEFTLDPTMAPARVLPSQSGLLTWVGLVERQLMA